MSGRAWKFGNDINTDLIAPGLYMKSSLDELASHCLEAIDPCFAGSAVEGDFVVAGRNFGIGSSREQAAQVLKVLGIAAVIATSFGGIFYRNAFNLGLPAIISNDIEKITSGDKITVNLKSGNIYNSSTSMDLVGEPIPENLITLIEAGGLFPHLQKVLHSFK